MSLICPLGKGGYFKDERSLGGRGVRQNAVSISNNDVIVYSNNDVILFSEGRRGSKKAQNLRSSLKYALQINTIFTGWEAAGSSRSVDIKEVTFLTSEPWSLVFSHFFQIETKTRLDKKGQDFHFLKKNVSIF